MSQLNGPIDYDLRKGISWNALIDITPTGQARRKIISEFGPTQGSGPRMLLQLDVFDRLSLLVSDSTGLTVASVPPVETSLFALRPVWIQAELFAAERTGSGLHLPVRGHIRINGALCSELSTVGSFGEVVLGGRYSIGAGLQDEDPATFRLFEIATVIRAPLTDEEIASMTLYFSEKAEAVYAKS